MKNEICQSEISVNLTRALVFSIWGGFSERTKEHLQTLGNQHLKTIKDGGLVPLPTT